MIDMKIFTNGRRGWGYVICSEKWKITRTAPILKSNSTSFSFKFFSIGLRLQFLQMGARAMSGWIFFWTYSITILFYQCNDKNIIHQQIYCCLSYIFTHSLYYYVIMSFSLLQKSLTFGCKKCIFSYSFWPRWLKLSNGYTSCSFVVILLINFK